MKLRISILLVLVSLTYTNANCVDDIEKYGAQYDYKHYFCTVDDDECKTQISRKITIFNGRGDEYANLIFSEDKYNKLDDLRIVLKDSSGDVIYTKKKKDLLKVCGYGGYSLYNDVCHYSGEFRAAQYPYSIEYEYTMKSTSLFFWSGAILQSRIPVIEAEYQLLIPEDIPFRSKIYNLSPESTMVSENPGMLLYTWSQRNIEAFDVPDYTPPAYDVEGTLALAAHDCKIDQYRMTGGEWSDIGLWYADMARNKYLDEDTDIIPDSSHLLDIVREEYDRVIQNIRYVSINVGIGGWQPSRAALTRDRGYGDCKDMATLLVSYLRERGIETYPCLVLTSSDGYLDVDFPRAMSFNHVIAAAILDADTVWLDPTCNSCPYYDLRYDDENINVLAITDDGGRIWRTAASGSEDNHIARYTRMHIDRDRMATINTKIVTTGNPAQHIRGAIQGMNRDERRQFVNRLFPGAEKKFKIKFFTITNEDAIYEPLIIEIDALRMKQERKIGDAIYCEPFQFYGSSSLDKVDVEDRDIPIYTYYPELNEDSICITWDTALHVSQVIPPDSVLQDFAFGRLYLSSQVTDAMVTLNYRKECTVYEIEPEHFPEYMQWSDILSAMGDARLKLSISPPAGSD